MSADALKGALCPAHLLPARGTCARCGAFLCETCPLGRFCEPCQQRIQRLQGAGDDRVGVLLPGVIMAVYGVVSFGLSLWIATLKVLDGPGDMLGEGLLSARGLLDVGLLVLPLVGAGVVAAAGIQMARNRGYRLAVAGAVVCIIPMATSCWFVSLGVGLWALVVLHRVEVRAAFEARQERLDGGGTGGP